ncbi:hypothetical protein MHK07_02950 [Moraxella nonliquefaciens]|nr:hypothetical protein [Moraxella nonliquefaciens]
MPCWSRIYGNTVYCKVDNWGEYLSKDDGTSLDGIGLTLTTKQMYEQVFIK